jgi:AcrR family transcriptional regulator
VSRFTDLTDAAIALVAESGMRGLTHRAVDTRAGLPQGTTSAYFRTRKSLIEALVQRLADLDQAGIDRDAVLPAGPVDLPILAQWIAALVDELMSTGRDRTLARYNCMLEATHRPELRPILGYGRVIREQARALLSAAGWPDPERAGDYFVAFIDGLLFDRLVGAGALSAPEPGTPQSRADLAAALEIFLSGLGARRPGGRESRAATGTGP